MFVYGTQNVDKEEWQTNFSINKLNTSIRAAQGKLVNILVNTPDWYELTPRGDNPQAEQLAPAFQKMLDYYLDAADFKKHAGTFFLCALISQGSLHVGWKSRLVQNPEYVLSVTQKAREDEQRKLASKVANPQAPVDASLQGSDLEDALSQSLDEFTAEAQGSTLKPQVINPYIQIGSLDLMDINHEKFYWEPNVMYMEDSPWKAFRYEVNKYELLQAAKLGYYKKTDVDRVGSQKDIFPRLANERLRYKNTIYSPNSKTDLVTLTAYFGPLIIDDEVVKDKYYALIANDNVILKDGDYPFWEPPGHNTPIVTTSVRQIPYRATGAGIGDNAVALQRLYDSNWQLICDTFRYGISGINVVNYANLVDKSQLDEGLYPGMTLQVRGKPEDSFSRIELTNNIENQAHPVQTMLEGAIDNLTGINELMTGGGNPYSRTSAKETDARLEAGSDNVNIIALDLEQNFITPALEACFARVLQFGITELGTNPELQALLTQEEQYEIQQLGADDRMQILNQWYTFKIEGFSGNQDKDAQAQRDNELLQIINSGGPLSTLINLPNFLRTYFKNRGIKDPEKLLLITNSPLQIVTSENQALMTGHMVQPNPNDDHEFHLKQQAPLAQGAQANPAIQQHVQIHAMYLQQQQQAQQQGQQAGAMQAAGPQGAPPPGQ